jgi:cytochrome c oxidase assembly protein subunit 15
MTAMSGASGRDRVVSAWQVARHRRLSPAGFRTITTVILAVMVLIIVSGAAVRLTDSGLGCPDWPSCTRTQVLAPLGIHPWIEQINRFINAGIGVVAVVGVAGALLRIRRRRDLTWLSLGVVGGVLAEIVLGGITVLEKLAPQYVSAHFLLGALILVNALVLRHRAGLADEDVAHVPGRAVPAGVPRTLVSRPQLWLSRLLLVGVAVVVTLGTVVTSTGPHGGSPQAPRYHLSLHAVAQDHGSSVEVFLGLTVLLCWWLARTGAPRAVLRRAEVLLAVTVAQGIVGYVQYATGVPAGLVEVHVIGAVAVMIAAVHLHLGLTERTPTPAAAPADPSAVSAPLPVGG